MLKHSNVSMKHIYVLTMHVLRQQNTVCSKNVLHNINNTQC